jgi:hypothetical protein
MHERRRSSAKRLDAQPAERGEQPVRAGLQHALEIAVAQQQAALVLLHVDTLELHGVLLVLGSLSRDAGEGGGEGCRYSGAERDERTSRASRCASAAAQGNRLGWPRARTRRIRRPGRLR